MRFLLRLLLLLALGSFLLRHYGSFIRENLWRVQTANNPALLNRPAGISEHDSHVRSAQANLPPGVLPRHDLTPGALDPRVTQRNIRNTICRRGYTASVRPPFEYTNAMKHRLMRVYGVRGSIHDYELDYLIPLELWAAVPTVKPISGRNPEMSFQALLKKTRWKITCTIRSARVCCRWPRHNEKSPPIGMRSTKQFTATQ
jgi:hypothetical protein